MSESICFKGAFEDLESRLQDDLTNAEKRYIAKLKVHSIKSDRMMMTGLAAMSLGLGLGIRPYIQGKQGVMDYLAAIVIGGAGFISYLHGMSEQDSVERRLMPVYKKADEHYGQRMIETQVEPFSCNYHVDRGTGEIVERRVYDFEAEKAKKP